ncbi:hypothetical protein [Halomonas halophila]
MYQPRPWGERAPFSAGDQVFLFRRSASSLDATTGARPGEATHGTASGAM